MRTAVTMQLFTQWKGVSTYLLRDPATFYDHYDETHDLGYPLVFLALSCLVVTLPVLVLGAALNASQPSAVAVVAAGTLALAAAIWLLTLLEAAVAHVVLWLAGVRGFSTTVEAFAFPAFIRYSLWWVPVANLVAHYYGLYLHTRGLARFHGVSEATAAVATVVAALSPLLVVVGVAVAAAFFLQIGTDPAQLPPVGALPL